MVFYLLYEASAGYGLFEALENESIALSRDSVQEASQDLARFGKLVKLKAFAPFHTAAMALDNINCISEGFVHDFLRDFLETQLPKTKPGKKSKTVLGIEDPKLGSQLAETLDIKCRAEDVTRELLRGIRLHFSKFVSALNEQTLEKAQLGLGHAYSRAKVKFNVNRADNMVIQAICLLDQLDKDINTFAMRAREWNSYAFPELSKLVPDHYMYAQAAKAIGCRAKVSDDIVDELEKIVGDTAVAQRIVAAARSSMGMDVSAIDQQHITAFLDRVIELSDYRKSLHQYLRSKMNTIAPNLSRLIGEMVGARLISKSGSLTNLAKYPASTVQILGAEKALFRALKTRGNTPKYGLIYHSSFIGRAGAKNKGRISRYLANKCSIASRIDCFAETPTDKFGQVMNEQVEERLRFYETGDAPRKNADVMMETVIGLREEGKAEKEVESAKKKKRKATDDAEVSKPKSKKSKKDSKAENEGKRSKKSKKKSSE